ncbi:PHO85 cyclin-1 [Coemansia sp. RSA 552]|nr:PHO85 cyclin-1 [Coemansia sp. RSA 552]
MCAQVDTSRGGPAPRPYHLNMAAPLTPRTLETIQCEITKDMIAAIAMHARNVIPCTPAPVLTSSERSTPAPAANGLRKARIGSDERLPSPPTTPSSSLASIPPLDMFITNLVLRSRVQAGTLICTLVYLQRLRSRLPKEARGMECTCHRIFLATLIVAGKYLNDASPKNKYWARYSTVFTVAEVNLMEKQLLFLLDFDLRIDNKDLNEAAAVFVAEESKVDGPLTPTTPPPSSTTAQPADSGDLVSALPSVRDKKADISVDSDGGHHPPHAFQKAAQSVPENTKIYPSNLGLGGQPHSYADTTPSAVPGATREKHNLSREHPGLAPESRDMRVPELSDHLASAASRCRRPSAVSALSAQKTPTSLLRHISSGDKTDLHPSPKKRAVSRGHHDNVPHPSPIYHCQASGVASTATTVAVPSSATANSACFLQPLEQASISYASSRYQQQRYDPHASRSRNGSRTQPRASVSIPSFRELDAMPPVDPVRDASPSGTASYSSRCSSRPQKTRHLLRHQSTLPDIASLSSSISRIDAPSHTVHVNGTVQRQPAEMGSGSSEMGSRLPCMARQLPPVVGGPYTGASALPMPPPPARLPSASYHLDSSPVNTLVHDQSPAAAAATVGYSGRARSYYRQASIPRGVHDTLPASVFSLAANGRSAHSASHHEMCEADTDRTLGYACEPDLRRTRHMSIMPRHAHRDTDSPGDAQHCDHYAQNPATVGISSTSSHSSAGSSGWQLKSKLLHPISTWFRSSRHQHGSGQLDSAAAQPSQPPLSAEHC